MNLSEPASLVHTLTPHQKQVLALVGCGKSHQEAADCMGISRKTLEKHRQRLGRKLSPKMTLNGAQLAIIAIKANLNKLKDL